MRGTSVPMYASENRTDTESALFDRWRRRGDERARAELVNRHMPLVRQLARRYAYTSEPLDDLVQVGSVGLLQALSRYDPRVGSSFKAYAVPTILGELRRQPRGGGPGTPPHAARTAARAPLRVPQRATRRPRPGRVCRAPPGTLALRPARRLELQGLCRPNHPRRAAPAFPRHRVVGPPA